MTVTIASLFPELTDSQGDAQNAAALSRILAWHAVDSRVEAVSADTLPAGDASVIVLGHVVASQYEQASRAFEQAATWVREQLSTGAVLLAVGAGQKLLRDAGLLAGEFTSRNEHHVDDLFVSSPLCERELWGFQNSEFTYHRARGEDSLGSVVYGSGNADRTEGVIRRYQAGIIVGTNMHGPICVRNPQFSLWLLAQAGVSLDTGVAAPEWNEALTLADALFAARRGDLDL